MKVQNKKLNQIKFKKIILLKFVKRLDYEIIDQGNLNLWEF